MGFRRMLLVAGMLTMSLCGGVIGGMLVDSPVMAARAQGPTAVTTTQVNIVDGEGRLRAVLAGVDERRMTSLSFYAPGGQVRGFIGIDENGTPQVRLLDPAGQRRFSAIVQGTDPLVIVGDETAQNGVFGSVDDSLFVSLFDGGRSRSRWQLDPDGAPSFSLFDSGGRQSLAMTVDATNLPMMLLHEDGRMRAAFGVREQTALLNFADPERMRLVLGVGQDGNPSISFLDERGEVAQQLPLPVTGGR